MSSDRAGLTFRARFAPLLSSPEMAHGATTMEKRTLIKGDQPKTEAMKNFEANLDPLEGLIRWLIPKDVLSSVQSFVQALKKWQKSSPTDGTFPLKREAAKVTTSIQNYVSVKNLSFEWMSVMLVTLLEGYLEDGLISLVSKNPKLMKDAPPIDHYRALEVASIEELRDEVRRQWAQDCLRPGGPATWLKRLKSMGARGYNEEATFKVQHLWDTRNLIVHSRGVASVAYARRYANLGAQKGARIKVDINQFQYWLDAIKDFMICTDAFFLKYGETKRDD
jgi:hypothetical protein